MEKTFLQRVAEVQSTLNAPKNQTNKFGGYKYRNLEDILEAAKPILKAQDIVLTLNDEIVIIGEKAFLKSTGKLTDALASENEISTTAFVELTDHKGMSAEQAVGASSSYCRKYCLGGLLLVDDNKDPDTNEFAQQNSKKERASNIAKKMAAKPSVPTGEQKKELVALIEENGLILTDVLTSHGVTGQMNMEQYNAIMSELKKGAVNE